MDASARWRHARMGERDNLADNEHDAGDGGQHAGQRTVDTGEAAVVEARQGEQGPDRELRPHMHTQYDADGAAAEARAAARRAHGQEQAHTAACGIEACHRSGRAHDGARDGGAVRVARRRAGT